jgi:hypothetical protein
MMKELITEGTSGLLLCLRDKENDRLTAIKIREQIKPLPGRELKFLLDSEIY